MCISLRNINGRNLIFILGSYWSTRGGSVISTAGLPRIRSSGTDRSHFRGGCWSHLRLRSVYFAFPMSLSFHPLPPLRQACLSFYCNFLFRIHRCHSLKGSLISWTITNIPQKHKHVYKKKKNLQNKTWESKRFAYRFHNFDAVAIPAYVSWQKLHA